MSIIIIMILILGMLSPLVRNSEPSEISIYEFLFGVSVGSPKWFCLLVRKMEIAGLQLG